METQDNRNPADSGTVSVADLASLVEEQRGRHLLAPAEGLAIPAVLLNQVRLNNAEIVRLQGEANRLATHSNGLLDGFRMAQGIFERDVAWNFDTGTYTLVVPPAETSGDQAAQAEGEA